MNFNLIENKIRERFLGASPQVLQEGISWYSKANSFCESLAKEHDLPIRLVAGLTALFSPMKSWEMNQRLVREWCECQNCGTFSLQKKRAIQLFSETVLIRSNEEQDKYIQKVLNGPKTKNFYHNIVYPTISNHVTIDTHIQKDLIPGIYLTPKRYRDLEFIIQEQAVEHKIIASALQAVLWVDIKREKKVKDKPKNN